MHTQKRETPGPQDRRPLQPEDLVARYDRWTIYRELHRDCSYGDWVAKPHQAPDDTPEKITATGIETLAEKLAAAEA